MRNTPGALVCTWRGTAAVAVDGSVVVFGPNDFLQHAAASSCARGVVSFADGGRCVELKAGSEHFAAVVEKRDGGRCVVTWGWGEHGQLGNGGADDSTVGCVLDIGAEEAFQVAAGAAFVVVVLCAKS